MKDDWRLRVDLHEQGDAHRLTERLEASDLEHELETSFHDRVIVTRDGAEVFCYTDNRTQANGVEKLIDSLARQHGWCADHELRRWHPQSEHWEDPDLELLRTGQQRVAEHEQLIGDERAESRAEGYPEWEVRVDCASHHDAVALAKQLQSEGVPSLRRWKYLLLGALDEDGAQRLADRIEHEAPAGASETVELSGRKVLKIAGTFPSRNPFVVL